MDNLMKYQLLRDTYPSFTYHNYTFDVTNHSLHITYHFTIDGLACFKPSWTIPLANQTIDCNDPLLHRYIFSLGLVELVSYWKISCAKKVYVNCGSLDQAQIKWFKKLYYHGLGEFFYINGIEESMDTFMEIIASNTSSAHLDCTKDVFGQLIPFGGGKDSYVSAHILKESTPNYAYVINDVISAVNAVNVAGYDDRFIHVHRTLDPVMLQLNKEGNYLNGHTPFSALVAFSSVLVSYIYGIENICLSNESSANESTIAGKTINHQYSKTYEFEADFKWYNENYLYGNIHYFSFLRPLNELQIAALFTSFKKYLTEFRSCNVGSKQGIWCGHCAKCCFVAMILAAFVDDQTLIDVFGHDMFNDESLIPLFDALIGVEKDKPFECVGTRKEVQAACILALQRRDPSHYPLVLNRYTNLLEHTNIVDEILHQKNTVHFVPENLYAILDKTMKGNQLW